MKKTYVSLIIFYLLGTMLIGQADISGHWYFMSKYGLDGSIEVKDDKAFFNLPIQSFHNVVAEQSKWMGDTLVARWGSPLSTTIKMIYRSDQDIVVADFTSSGKQFNRVLSRLSGPLELKRPQTPVPPFPYDEEDIRFTNPIANIDLAGTLSLPRGAGPFPAVVLVSGSGPQNRDEEILGHRSFAVMADFLTRSGIAVLRYDDRGIGSSEGKFTTATTGDFADDTEAGISFLSSHNKIDPQRLGILGHSEGGMIAAIVASRNKKLGFIILLAGPTTPITELFNKQNELVHADKKKSDSFLAKNRTFNKEMYALINTGKETSDLYAPLIELVHNYYESQDTDEDKQYLGSSKEAYYMAIASQIFSPWFRYFISFNPEDYLSKVDCPILGIYGKNDLQVYWKDSVKGLENIGSKYGNEQIETKTYVGHNHLFQRCLSGSMEEYGVIEQTISPEVLLDISDWILKTTK